MGVAKILYTHFLSFDFILRLLFLFTYVCCLFTASPLTSPTHSIADP